MSHIHLPDGVVSPIWWILGFILTFGIVFYIIRTIKQENVRQKIPHTGVAAAIMLIGMSVPLFIVPVHLSLAVLTGILIGPKLGFLAVLVVNFILAFVGHGGITLVGINTLIIGSEVLIGYHLFRFITRKASFTIGTMIATGTAVIISMLLMVSFVGYTAGITEALPHQCGGEDQNYEQVYNEDVYGTEGLEREVAKYRYVGFTGWTAIILIFICGLLIESIGTTLIIKYFVKVRPGMVVSIDSQNT